MPAFRAEMAKQWRQPTPWLSWHQSSKMAWRRWVMSSDELMSSIIRLTSGRAGELSSGLVVWWRCFKTANGVRLSLVGQPWWILNDGRSYMHFRSYSEADKLFIDESLRCMHYFTTGILTLTAIPWSVVNADRAWPLTAFTVQVKKITDRLLNTTPLFGRLVLWRIFRLYRGVLQNDYADWKTVLAKSD